MYITQGRKEEGRGGVQGRVQTPCDPQVALFDHGRGCLGGGWGGVWAWSRCSRFQMLNTNIESGATEEHIWRTQLEEQPHQRPTAWSHTSGRGWRT